MHILKYLGGIILSSKKRLTFISNIGYFYFAFIFFILIAVIVFGTYLLYTYGFRAEGISNYLIKIGIPATIVIVAVLRGFLGAMFSKIPEPYGLDITKENAPGFYSIIEDICEKSGCPTIHNIKFDFDSNAYISERPSFGLIGAYKRYLVIGLPLLTTLTEEEIKAVIAHECGHLSKSHSKDSVKIYRAKLIWGKIREELKKTDKDRIFLIRIFMQRYIPALNDIMFKISKEHEYQADRIAASVVNSKSIGSSLLKMNIYDLHLKYTLWDKIYNLNMKEKNPPKDLFSQMEKSVNEPIDEELIQSITEELLSYPSLPSSTHPSISERMEALNADTPKFNPTKESALRQIFKEQADGIISALSEEWKEEIKYSWKEYYKSTKEEEQRLLTLNEKHNTNTLLDKEVFERAYLIESIEGTEKALLTFEEIKKSKSNEIYANYHIGRLMLKQDNKEGLEILEKVMEEDCQLIPECCNEIVNYHLYKGEVETAAEYYHHAVEFIETDEEVKEERASINKRDTFVEHDLSYDTLVKLRELLIGYKEIKKAYVVIKHTSLSENFPMYVIGVNYGNTTKKRRYEIQLEIVEGRILPWDYWVTDLNEDKELEYIIDEMSDTRIV